MTFASLVSPSLLAAPTLRLSVSPPEGKVARPTHRNLTEAESSAAPWRQSAGDARPGTAAGMRRFGKLCFVDLAGSERLKETGGGGTASVRETGT